MATIAQITALYNQVIDDANLDDKPVKKFKDKATAEHRLDELCSSLNLCWGEDDCVLYTYEAPEEQPTTQRGRAPVHADDATVHVMVDNPKRKGTKSHARFELYQNGKTIGEYIAAGGTRADIRWDEAHGYIEITDK